MRRMRRRGHLRRLLLLRIRRISETIDEVIERYCENIVSYDDWGGCHVGNVALQHKISPTVANPNLVKPKTHATK
ncbi:MAG: hypothetical protein Q9219_000862 [cf. Caloplaca sp. 3 TL-2023]